MYIVEIPLIMLLVILIITIVLTVTITILVSNNIKDPKTYIANRDRALERIVEKSLKSQKLMFEAIRIAEKHLTKEQNDVDLLLEGVTTYPPLKD